MNIFLDVHTYVVLSFLLMVFILFKKGYKKIEDSLDENVSSIKNQITSLENRKIEAINQLQILKEDLLEANSKINKSILNAEEEAKKILEKASTEIGNIILEKQKESENTAKKIKDSLNIELKNKIVNLVIEDLKSKLKNIKEDRYLQNINIENSTNMLEDLVNKYVK